MSFSTPTVIGSISVIIALFLAAGVMGNACSIPKTVPEGQTVLKQIADM